MRALAAAALDSAAPAGKMERRAAMVVNERVDPRAFGGVIEIGGAERQRGIEQSHRHPSRPASPAPTAPTRPHWWRAISPRSLPALAPTLGTAACRERGCQSVEIS